MYAVWNDVRFGYVSSNTVACLREYLSVWFASGKMGFNSNSKNRSLELL